MTFGIVVGSDTTLFGQGLEALIGRQQELRLLGRAADGQGLVRLVGEAHPDVAVLTARLPGLNALDVAGRVGGSGGAKVIVLAVDPDRDYVLQGLEVGVDGFLMRESTFSELVQAIHAVCSQQRYFSPRLAELVAEPGRAGRNHRPGSVFTLLTPREREVLQLIAEGHTTKGIAGRLGVSVKTVEWHRQQLMHKLDRHSIASLTRYALREGLVAAGD